jgi:hypothetical protein
MNNLDIRNVNYFGWSDKSAPINRSFLIFGGVFAGRWQAIHRYAVVRKKTIKSGSIVNYNEQSLFSFENGLAPSVFNVISIPADVSTNDPTASIKYVVREWSRPIKLSPFAIVTMVSSAHYVEGANTLQYTIRKYSSSPVVHEGSDFIAMVLRERAVDNAVIISKLQNWTIATVNVVPPPVGAKVFGRFIDLYTKLVVWSWTHYKRVLFIDADCMAIGDLAPLLTKPIKDFAAARDWVLGRTVRDFNVGVFSLRPDAGEFDKLLSRQN